MRDIRPIVRSHHERWDGRGYPDGLSAEAIPLLARVVAVADSFDAMTTKRPYNVGHVKTPEQAFVEVEKCSGAQFDPKCAQAFLAVREKVMEALRSSRTTGTFYVTAGEMNPPPAGLSRPAHVNTPFPGPFYSPIPAHAPSGGPSPIGTRPVGGRPPSPFSSSCPPSHGPMTRRPSAGGPTRPAG